MQLITNTQQIQDTAAQLSGLTGVAQIISQIYSTFPKEEIEAPFAVIPGWQGPHWMPVMSIYVPGRLSSNGLYKPPFAERYDVFADPLKIVFDIPGCRYFAYLKDRTVVLPTQEFVDYVKAHSAHI